jgi:hypothetical protein
MKDVVCNSFDFLVFACYFYPMNATALSPNASAVLRGAFAYGWSYWFR